MHKATRNVETFLMRPETQNLPFPFILKGSVKQQGRI